MLPPVSPPIAAMAIPDATAAPLPLDEPPGSRLRSYGFLVVSFNEEVENQDAAQSGIVDFARMMAPASFSLRTSVASFSGV